MATFQYKIRKARQPDYPKGEYKLQGIEENLTGYIDGSPASDLEERFATSMRRQKIPFVFRYRLSMPMMGKRELTQQRRNLPGEVEIDFIAGETLVQPIMIDGEIAHFKTQWQKTIDDDKVAIVDEFGKQLGWLPTVRIPYWEIDDSEKSNRKVEELF